MSGLPMSSTPATFFDPIAVEMMSQPDGPLSEEASEIAGHLDVLRQDGDHMGIFKCKFPSLFGEVESDGEDDHDLPEGVEQRGEITEIDGKDTKWTRVVDGIWLTAAVIES